jgi:hypothetical protein
METSIFLLEEMWKPILHWLPHYSKFKNFNLFLARLSNKLESDISFYLNKNIDKAMQKISNKLKMSYLNDVFMFENDKIELEKILYTIYNICIKIKSSRLEYNVFSPNDIMKFVHHSINGSFISVFTEIIKMLHVYCFRASYILNKNNHENLKNELIVIEIYDKEYNDYYEKLANYQTKVSLVKLKKLELQTPRINSSIIRATDNMIKQSPNSKMLFSYIISLLGHRFLKLESRILSALNDEYYILNDRNKASETAKQKKNNDRDSDDKKQDLSKENVIFVESQEKLDKKNTYSLFKDYGILILNNRLRSILLKTDNNTKHYQFISTTYKRYHKDIDYKIYLNSFIVNVLDILGKEIQFRLYNQHYSLDEFKSEDLYKYMEFIIGFEKYDSMFESLEKEKNESEMIKVREVQKINQMQKQNKYSNDIIRTYHNSTKKQKYEKHLEDIEDEFKQRSLEIDKKYGQKFNQPEFKEFYNILYQNQLLYNIEEPIESIPLASLDISSFSNVFSQILISSNRELNSVYSILSLYSGFIQLLKLLNFNEIISLKRIFTDFPINNDSSNKEFLNSTSKLLSSFENDSMFLFNQIWYSPSTYSMPSNKSKFYVEFENTEDNTYKKSKNVIFEASNHSFDDGIDTTLFHESNFILVSGMVYNCSFLFPFNPLFREEKILFKRFNGSKSSNEELKVSSMKVQNKSFNTFKTDKFVFLELPMENNHMMELYYPLSKETEYEIINGQSHTQFRKDDQKSKMTKFSYVQIPKLDLKSSYFQLKKYMSTKSLKELEKLSKQKLKMKNGQEISSISYVHFSKLVARDMQIEKYSDEVENVDDPSFTADRPFLIRIKHPQIIGDLLTCVYFGQ